MTWNGTIKDAKRAAAIAMVAEFERGAEACKSANDYAPLASESSKAYVNERLRLWLVAVAAVRKAAK